MDCIVYGVQQDMTERLLLSAFFMVQLSHLYMTSGKTISLTRWTFVGRVMFLLFNTLSKKKETIRASRCTSAGRWQPRRIMESVQKVVVNIQRKKKERGKERRKKKQGEKLSALHVVSRNIVSWNFSVMYIFVCTELMILDTYLIVGHSQMCESLRVG